MRKNILSWRPLTIPVTLLALLLGLTGCAQDDASSTTAPHDDLRTLEGALAWSAEDDPSGLGDAFEYRLDELPTSGAAATTPWVGSYWPTHMDSINYPWEGEGTDSPTTKYAKAFDRTGLEDRVSAFIGIDSIEGSEDSPVVECTDDSACDSDKAEVCAKRAGATEGRCIPSWFGLCHAWAPASIMEKEPEGPVTHNGVTFKVNDLKALTTLSYTSGLKFELISLRCNKSDAAEQLTYDEYGNPDAECADTNAGTFHVATTNLLGLQQTSFIEDRTFDFEVWNQPVRAYEITTNLPLTAAEANTLAGAQESTETYLFNTKAVAWRHVGMSFQYMGESPSTLDGNLSSVVDNYTYTETYEYVLELDGDGRIVGGEWVGSSKKQHPDFLWYGTSKKFTEVAKESFEPGTGIAWDHIEMLLELSHEAPPPEVTDGFVWGDGCESGGGDFDQPVAYYATLEVGQIPTNLDQIKIELESDEDVDIQLIDEETGHEIIAWPNGDLNGPTEACTTFHGVEYCYSGYNGVGDVMAGSVPNWGHEWIEINNVSNRPLVMKAFGYNEGVAKVTYSWTAAPDCVDSGSGTFTQVIAEKDVVDVGVIPAGKQNIKVTLSSDEDVDIQLYDGENAIVMWPDGLLNGPTAASVEYEGMTVSYSGYNGGGLGQQGIEYIRVQGEVTVDLTMKAFGYVAGDAQVDYFWGLSDEDLMAPSP